MSAIDEVLTVASATVFFGTNRKRAHNKYLRYMHSIHPDISDDRRAGEATAHLNAMWEEYTGGGATASTADGTMKAHGSAPHHITHTVTTDAEMNIILDATGRCWLLVNRHAGLTIPRIDDNVYKSCATWMLKATGSPVALLSPSSYETISIRQSDGPHMAYRVAHAPQDGSPYGLADLLNRFHGAPDGRDVAWLFKRVLFLAGLFDETNSRIIDPEYFLNRLIVHPESHGFVVVDYSQIGASDGHADNVAILSKAFLKLLDTDGVDGKLIAFIRGCTVNSKPSAGDLLKEFDGVLYDLYGAPSFHKMIVE